MNGPGGFFSVSSWERARARLHHDDYHYRFYHYLARPLGHALERLVYELALAIMDPSFPLPLPAAKAFRNWPGISAALHDLFECAPREALAEPQAVLARMALEQVESDVFPESVRAVVRERAQRVLAECAKRDKERVEQAIAEPRRLVEAIDEFVALLSADDRIAEPEAEQRVHDFLDNCRRLDRALSDIPRRLRDGDEE